MSNYPMGVSDSHPHFNPPRVSASAVECGADEALVMPAHTVVEGLKDLERYINSLTKGRGMEERPHTVQILESIVNQIGQLQERLAPLEQETEYECPFADEVDLEESECARWDCPVCGNERETDTMPEERDPDEEWERRNER